MPPEEAVAQSKDAPGGGPNLDRLLLRRRQLRHRHRHRSRRAGRDDGYGAPSFSKTSSSSSSSSSSRALLLTMAAAVAVTSSSSFVGAATGGSSAFVLVHDDVVSASRSRCRRFHDGANGSSSSSIGGGSSSAVIVHQRRQQERSLAIPTRLSSSSGSGDVWSEVFQNAVGSLDRRLEIEEERRIGAMIDEDDDRGNGRRSVNGNSGNVNFRFVSPLLEDGYPPAVIEYEERRRLQPSSLSSPPEKPMLLYLPGFDGTTIAPFLQFPSLGEEFDVRALRVGMDDRSTFEELKDAVVEYLLRECGAAEGGGTVAVYLVGESFGGILATEVALELNRPACRDYVDLRGLVLINPATSYLRSRLYELGPAVAKDRPLLPRPFSDVQYVVSLATKLVPLFLDEGRAMRQLVAILSSKGLPSVVNNPRREAYMGRVAFDLPNRLKFMPRDTLEWRLEEWLEWGCGVFEDRLEMLRSARGETSSDDDDDDGAPPPPSPEGGDAETSYALLRVSQELRTLVVVGELDVTLPSLEEAGRLSSEVFRNARVHVVPGAGHASTCGGSLDLMRLIREAFPETDVHGNGDGDSYYDGNVNGNGWATGGGGGGMMEELHGLEPRYDGASIGLNPLLYWSKDYYRKWRRE